MPESLSEIEEKARAEALKEHEASADQDLESSESAGGSFLQAGKSKKQKKSGNSSDWSSTISRKVSENAASIADFYTFGGSKTDKSENYKHPREVLEDIDSMSDLN